MKEKKGKIQWRMVDKYEYYFKDADEKLKRSVWAKGETIPGRKEDSWRKDIVDTEMAYAEHGNRKSVLGWEIDHIIPRKHGGSDELSNLQPLQWSNNAEKGDRLDWP